MDSINQKRLLQLLLRQAKGDITSPANRLTVAEMDKNLSDLQTDVNAMSTVKMKAAVGNALPVPPVTQAHIGSFMMINVETGYEFTVSPYTQIAGTAGVKGKWVIELKELTQREPDAITYYTVGNFIDGDTITIKDTWFGNFEAIFTLKTVPVGAMDVEIGATGHDTMNNLSIAFDNYLKDNFKDFSLSIADIEQVGGRWYGKLGLGQIYTTQALQPKDTSYNYIELSTSNPLTLHILSKNPRAETRLEFFYGGTDTTRPFAFGSHDWNDALAPNGSRPTTKAQEAENIAWKLLEIVEDEAPGQYTVTAVGDGVVLEENYPITEAALGSGGAVSRLSWDTTGYADTDILTITEVTVPKIDKPVASRKPFIGNLVKLEGDVATIMKPRYAKVTLAPGSAVDLTDPFSVVLFAKDGSTACNVHNGVQLSGLLGFAVTEGVAGQEVWVMMDVDIQFFIALIGGG